MSYLLDTHAFLWFINDDKLLSADVKTLIETTDETIYLSIASLWEMAIKISLGRLNMPLPFVTFISDQLRDNYITVLDISIEHLELLTTLPFHHPDPFDRLLIAQSLSETLPIICNDAVFDEYGVQRYW